MSTNTDATAKGAPQVTPSDNGNLTQKVHNYAQIATGSRYESLTQNGSRGRRRGPHAATRHLTQNLPSLLRALEDVSHEAVVQAAKGKGMLLQAPDGNQHFVDPAWLLQHKFGISRRSAYRHIRNGTTPNTQRLIGRDGKTYPAGSYIPAEMVEKNLRLAWQAFKRAERKADEGGISQADVARLEKLSEAVLDTLGRWRAAS